MDEATQEVVKRMLATMQTKTAKALARAGDKWENDSHLVLESVDEILTELLPLVGLELAYFEPDPED